MRLGGALLALLEKIRDIFCNGYVICDFPNVCVDFWILCAGCMCGCGGVGLGMGLIQVFDRRPNGG